MSSTLRVKRRTSGATGAPASLKSAEIAYNNMDGVLYIGFGDDGSGNATSVKAFAKDSFNPSAVYQTQDGDLDAIAALTTTGLLVRNASNSWVHRTLTGTTGRIGVTNGDGVAGNPTIDLATVAVGAAVSGGSTKFTVDTYGRITNAGQASMSDLSAPTADISIGNFKLTNVATPVSATDAATKAYVDNAIQGLNAKNSVLAATTGQQALSGGTAFPTIDGIATAAGNRVLLMAQTAPAENGIYVVGGTATAWTLTRSSDMDNWAEVPSAYAFVERGTTNADKGFVSTSDQGGTLGTTAITFTQFNGAGNVTASGSSGLTLAGNALSVNVNSTNGTAITGNNVSLTGQALALHQVVTSTDTVIYATGAGAFATTSFTSFGRSLVGAANAAAAQSTLGLVIGTNVQAYSARTTNEQALNITTADNVIVYGASNAAAVYQLGAVGKSVMGAATQGAAQSALGLGTMATQNASAVAITGGTIDGVTLDGGTF